MTPIDQAIAALRAGELVVFPTETVYGLGADALRPEAVARIFVVKQRPPTVPITVHLGRDALPGFWGRWSSEATCLADRYWPGPLTIIVPRTDRVPDVVTAGSPNVGLRVPDHPLALAMLDGFGGGVAGTSANRHGRISPTTPDHVRAELGTDTPLLLDGGACPTGLESTVLLLTGGTPTVLRSGAIAAHDLEEVLGRPVHTAPDPSEGYDLRTPVKVRPLASLTDDLDPQWQSLAVLAPHLIEVPGRDVAWVAAAPDPDTYARTLFETLRALDSRGHDVILVAEVPRTGRWAAIATRLDRAARGPHTR